MSFINAISYLFFPKTCVFCQEKLLQNEIALCSNCRHQLPVTDFIDTPNNLIENSFKGRVPIIAATALLYFKKKGIAQELIHQLKYKNRQDVGVFFGKWMGKQLSKSPRFKEIDAIVFVPLHSKKTKIRGYNQLQLFSEELSKAIKIPIVSALKKIENAHSQTKKDRLNRFAKINNSFKLTNPETLVNKHLLLVDDVITSGATLEACANELLKVKGVRISIATMVATDYL